jgi:hypothetical protein
MVAVAVVDTRVALVELLYLEGAVETTALIMLKFQEAGVGRSSQAHPDKFA